MNCLIVDGKNVYLAHNLIIDSVDSMSSHRKAYGRLGSVSLCVRLNGPIV